MHRHEAHIAFTSAVPALSQSSTGNASRYYAFSFFFLFSAGLVDPGTANPTQTMNAVTMHFFGAVWSAPRRRSVGCGPYLKWSKVENKNYSNDWQICIWNAVGRFVSFIVFSFCFPNFTQIYNYCLSQLAGLVGPFLLVRCKYLRWPSFARCHLCQLGCGTRSEHAYSGFPLRNDRRRPCVHNKPCYSVLFRHCNGV